MEFFLGIGMGIMISLIYSFGPAFFSLLQTSVHYGFKVARPFAFGVNLSDIITVSLLLTVLSGVDMVSLMHNLYVVIMGGSVLVLFAIYFFLHKTHDAEDSGSVMKFRAGDAPKWYSVYLRGFAINFFNPIIWLYWVSIVAMASGAGGVSTNHLYLFFAGVLLTTVSLDVLKCKLASMLQRFLTARVLNIMNKIIGCILLAFAAYLVFSMLLSK
ncbi:MAG: LysE family transporter [Bacteroidales bacterium]|nr:LysE family transporter [Bacteroidales bacterium]